MLDSDARPLRALKQWLGKINATSVRLIGRSSWSLADQIAAPVLQLLLTPYLFSRIGAEHFGLWALSSTFLIATQFVSMGTSAALVREIAQRRGNEKHGSAVSAIQCALAVTICGSALLLVISLLIPFALAPTFGQERVISAGLFIFLTALLVVTHEFDNIFSSSLRGLERFDIAAKTELVGRLIWAGGLLLVAISSSSVISLLLVSVALVFVKAIVKAAVLQRVLSTDAKIWSPSLSRREARALMPFGGWQLVQTMSGVLFASIDRWIIGGWLGPAQLAIYSICLQFAQTPHTLLAAALQIIVPMTSRTVRPGGNSMLPRNAFRGALAVATVSLIAALSLGIGAGPLLRLWISSEFAYQNTSLVHILVFAFAILAFNVPSFYVLIGLGKVRLTSILNLAAGCLGAIWMLGLIVVDNVMAVEQFAWIRVIYSFVILGSWFQLNSELRKLRSDHPTCTSSESARIQ